MDSRRAIEKRAAEKEGPGRAGLAEQEEYLVVEKGEIEEWD